MISKYTGLNESYFVSYEVSDRLCKIGFDYPTTCFWDTTQETPKIGQDELVSIKTGRKPIPIGVPVDWNGESRYELRGLISAPTYYDVMEWYKNHSIFISFVPTVPMDLIGTECYYYFWKWVIAIRGEIRTSRIEYNSHYEALEKAIEYLLRIKESEKH